MKILYNEIALHKKKKNRKNNKFIIKSYFISLSNDVFTNFNIENDN